MASTGNTADVDITEDNGNKRGATTGKSIYCQRIQALRRMRAIESNKGLITAFAILCSLVVMVTYLETSRMLLPTKVVSTRELRTLTSGFTNDLPSKDTKEQPAWTGQFLRPHRPRALFVGFSHCGGRDILSTLASHPEVAASKKEMKYFTGNTTLKRYLSHMPPSSENQLTIDICWTCITNRTSLKKIKSFDKTMKIIIVVCDPISRLLSSQVGAPGTKLFPTSYLQYTHHQFYDIESLKSKIFVNYSLLNNLNAELLTRNGDYFRHIVDLLEIFPRKQVFVIERERFRKNIVSELFKLHNFLGVNSQSELYGLDYNKDKDTMCYNFTVGTSTCIDVMPQNLTEVFTAEPGLLNSLKQFFKPFNRRLFLYLGIKYDWSR